MNDKADHPVFHDGGQNRIVAARVGFAGAKKESTGGTMRLIASIEPQFPDWLPLNAGGMRYNGRRTDNEGIADDLRVLEDA